MTTRPPAEKGPPRVAMRGIVKRFGATLANDAVDLDIHAGEVLALLGENGAGKSTLMRTLMGVHAPDAGHIEVEGRPCVFRSPREAMAAGIGMVFQQFSLIPALSVLENLLVAWPRAPWWQGRGRRTVREASAWLHRIAPGLSVARRVDTLSVGERQAVELAKVLNLDPRVVILDEPTSVLTPAEMARLHGFVRDLAREGKAVVLITHKIADVTACADRIAILRRGRLIETAPATARSPAEIVTAMVGAAPAEASAPPQMSDANGGVRLKLARVATPAGQAGRPVSDISLDIRRGEILGVAGVAGSGQMALAEAICGLLPLEAGEITLDGTALSERGSARALSQSDRIAYIPERPIDNAVVADLDVGLNLNLHGLPRQPFLATALEPEHAVEQRLRHYDVRPPIASRPAVALSGGNLQKLVIARELAGEPALIVACYPAMGLDVAAAARVRRLLFEHAARGAAVLWFSEDLDELLSSTHRIAVLHSGRLAGIVPTAGASRDNIGRLMAGVEEARDAA